MIVIDTSAYVATAFVEPEADVFAAIIARSGGGLICAANLTEAGFVTLRRFPNLDTLDLWLARYRVEVVPVDEALARGAVEAFARYGKGRHPAGLNFGDCFAYALAHARGLPLLFKGGDFARTDIARAAPA